MAGHPAGDRVDAVEDVDPLMLEELRERTDGVLRLGDREPVAGHEHDLARVGEHDRQILRRRRAHAAPVLERGRSRACLHRAERPEEDVADRAVHRPAHHQRQQRARGADERAGDDEHVVVEEKAGGRGGNPRESVQQRDHHGHVGAADRQHEENAESERGHDQRDDDEILLGSGDDQAAEDERGQQHGGVHVLLARIDDRTPAQQLLQLRERDQRAGEGDAADQRREQDRDRLLGRQLAGQRRPGCGTPPARSARRRRRRPR